MKRIFSMVALAAACISLTYCSDNDSPSEGGGTVEYPSPVAIPKSNSMQLYMHYMPWFESNESSANGKWGYHWTMANKNPDKISPDGKREIASHYYPMIGPYHSGDPYVIENHLLTMKYSGVDGLLINWYGSFDLNDFKDNRINSEQIIEMCKKLGMNYALVYEDRFLPDIVGAGLAPTIASAARVDAFYMNKHYFGDSNYIKLNGKPLLLNFGPISLTTPNQWTTAFSVIEQKPEFLTLWNQSDQAGANAQGEFAWVYKDNNALVDFYTNRIKTLKTAIAGAYPGFVDYYAEGGGGSNMGWSIPHNNGATFDETLNLAKNSGLKHLQLITWNDFGEGTMIEPTKEFGFSYVQKLKNFAGVQEKTDVFPEIFKLFELRKKYPSNSDVQRKLDEVAALFAANQATTAISKLSQIQ